MNISIRIVRNANGFSIVMERNDLFLNDRDKCALFASMSFTTAGKEKGKGLI